MASERDLELLDDYLTNRLTGSEKVEFEQKLQQDPDLQSELKFQQQIADGIKKARAGELKAFLNQIAIPPANTFGGAELMKWTTAGLIGAAGVALYLYLKKPVDQPLQQEVVTEKKSEIQKTEPESDNSQNNVIAPDSQSQKPTTAAVEKPRKQTANQQVDKQAEAKDPKKLEVFNPSEESESEGNGKAPETQLPLEEGTPSDAARTSVIINTDSKYDFHYELKGNELTLYGHFEKNLYTIMEFKSEDKQNVIFMYYKNNYYLLNQSAGKVNRLVPVNDPALLKRLREQRAAQ